MILPKERDPRFVTIRRSGTLTDSDHRLLALWAAACAKHVKTRHIEDGIDHVAQLHARFLPDRSIGLESAGSPPFPG